MKNSKLLPDLVGAAKTPKEIERKKHIEVGKQSFRQYCNLMNPDFFKENRNYQEELCDTMQLAFEKKLINPKTKKPYDILIINLPPGFGKSYTGIMFATWVYGRRKKAQIIAVSYGQGLSLQFAKAVRDAIFDKEIEADPDYYVVNSFFPDVRIKDGDGAMERWSLEGSYNSYLATSIDGSITGMRGNIGIIDDPIKNAEEAVNDRVKDKHWQFYKDTFLSRMLDGALQIIIQTRWATDDLAGRVMNKFPERCFVLKMPAVGADGKSLCEDLYSTEDLMQKKDAMSAHIWTANYEQTPIDLKGALYGAFKTYDAVDKGKFERQISYTDTADEGADYLCSISGGVIGKYGYVEDIYYTDAPMEATEPEVARRQDLYDIREAVVESNNGGRGFARNVEGRLKRVKNKKCYVTWFHQSKNKRTRILVNSTNVMEQIIMPDGWEQKFPDFYQAIIKYQRQGKNAHDDAADALTGFVEMINGEVKGKKKMGALRGLRT